MKKLLMSSLLAASSVFAVTACTSVGAATDTSSSYSNTQKQHKDAMRGPLSQLNLTPSQQTQIQAIMQNKRDGRKTDQANHKAEHAQMQQQMQALTNGSTLNSSAVNRLADQQAAKTKQRFIERAQTQYAISQVLTVEQRAKLAQLKLERKDKGRHASKNSTENHKTQPVRQQQGM